MLKNDTLKNGTSRIGSYRSAPPGPQLSKSKTKQQITALKNDCNLFARLYIACRTRDGNLEEFFKHENQSTPPSLSTMGRFELGMDLIYYLAWRLVPCLIHQSLMLKYEMVLQ